MFELKKGIEVKMEKKLGLIAVIVKDRTEINEVNAVISEFGELIMSRNGVTLKEENLHVISLVLLAEQDEINQLAGKLGKFKTIKVKTLQTTLG